MPFCCFENKTKIVHSYFIRKTIIVFIIFTYMIFPAFLLL